MVKAGQLPRWVDIGLLPLINLTLAFVISGLVIAMIGIDPFAAMATLLYGAFGYPEAIGYTLYYATNFIFAGLAVAIAFHAGLFNIGGEGQAYIAGLGVALVALAFDGTHPLIVLPLGILAAMAFGAGWAFVPAWLQARRGSHIVITTIMFNFIASAVMTYLLVNVLIAPGQQAPESRAFETAAHIPALHDIAAALGFALPQSPLNLSFVIAIAVAGAFWVYTWRTRWGYEIRALGQNETAARYGGIEPGRIIIRAMLISGGLAGLIAVNEIMGVHHRLMVDYVSGYGFVGIAVALMGRNHPVGVILAALLFGALYQGGAEIAFEFPSLSRDFIILLQGIIILLSGALENAFRPALTRIFARPA